MHTTLSIRPCNLLNKNWHRIFLQLVLHDPASLVIEQIRAVNKHVYFIARLQHFLLQRTVRDQLDLADLHLDHPFAAAEMKMLHFTLIASPTACGIRSACRSQYTPDESAPSYPASSPLPRSLSEIDLLDYCRFTDEAGDELGLRVFVNIPWRTLLFQPPFIDDHDFIRNLNRLILVMRDEDRSDADALDHFLQPGAQLRTNFCINRRERLIEQQQLRLRRKRSGESDPLTLTAGQLMRVTMLEAFQAR